MGVSVIPVKSGTKEPHFTGWPEKASTDPAKVSFWAEAFEGCSWAAVASASTVFILDDDSNVMSGWLAQNEDFATFTVQTSPGHRQYYFKQTDASRALGAVTQPDTDGKFSIRFDRQYGVFYGKHPKGHQYAIVSTAPIAPAPDSLVEYLSGFVTKPEKLDPTTDENREKSFKELKEFLDWGGISYGPDKVSDNGLLYVDIHGCPLHDGKHTHDEAIVGVGDNGGKRFSCFRCKATKQWSDYRAWVEAERGEKYTGFSRPNDPTPDEDTAHFEFAPTPRNSSITTTLTVKETTDAPTTPPNTEAPKRGKFKFPQVLDGTMDDYIFGPRHYEFAAKDFTQKPATYEGWFPRSSLSIIGGSSGAGKTSFIAPLLVKQAAREEHAGHPTYGFDYLIFLRDRGKFSLARTLRRLGLNIPQDQIVPLMGIGISTTTKAILNGIESRCEQTGKIPEVIFIEAMDFLLDDMNKQNQVVAFCDILKEVAEYYHMAVVGSVGAAKRLKKDGGVKVRRDSLIGSTAWARGAETIIQAEEDEEEKQNYFTVMHRNSAWENFVMQFNYKGQLEDVPAEEVQDPPLYTWFRKRSADERTRYATVDEVVKELKLRQSTAYKQIEGAVKKGVLTKKRGPRGGKNLYCWAGN